MLFELLFLIAASAPEQPAGETKPSAVVSAYDAVVVADETPAARDLAKPAVLIRESGKSLIVTVSPGRSIA